MKGIPLTKSIDLELPDDDEPDGEIFLPHHFWLGLIIMLGGWLWWGSDPMGAHVALIGFLILADDLLEHYFGIWTPLDAAFKFALRRSPRFRRWYRWLLSLPRRWLG